MHERLPDFDPALSVDGHVSRTPLMIVYRDGRITYRAAVLSTDGTHYVRVAGPRAVDEVAPCSLSPDGRYIVYVTQVYDAGQSVCVYSLEDGEETWFMSDAGDRDVAAALSPDGRELGIFTSTDEDTAALDTIEVSSGVRRRLVERPGGWFAESTVRWSPDGRFLAMTYLVDGDEDDDSAVLVLDTTRPAVVFEEAGYVMPMGNCWTTPRELFLGIYGVSSHVLSLDGMAPRMQKVSDMDLVPMAVSGDQLIWCKPDVAGRPVPWRSPMDGGNGAVYLRGSGTTAIHRLDLAWWNRSDGTP